MLHICIYYNNKNHITLHGAGARPGPGPWAAAGLGPFPCSGPREPSPDPDPCKDKGFLLYVYVCIHEYTYLYRCRKMTISNYSLICFWNLQMAIRRTSMRRFWPYCNIITQHVEIDRNASKNASNGGSPKNKSLSNMGISKHIPNLSMMDLCK